MTWDFTSHEQLVEAGYVWRRNGRCEDCGRAVYWYTNVNRRFVPVDPKTYALHFVTCPKGQAAQRDSDAEFLRSLGVRPDEPVLRRPRRQRALFEEGAARGSRQGAVAAGTAEATKEPER